MRAAYSASILIIIVVVFEISKTRVDGFTLPSSMLRPPNGNGSIPKSTGAGAGTGTGTGTSASYRSSRRPRRGRSFMLDVNGESSDQITRTSNNSNTEINGLQRSRTGAESQVDEDDRKFHTEAYVLVQAALIGCLSGSSVGLFKLSIEGLRQFAYGSSFLATPTLFPLIPAVGGIAVGLIRLLGPFPPGLRGTVEAADRLSRDPPRPIPYLRATHYVRKTAAAVCTLGTGCSLGPEGPSVEVGMAMSRLFCFLEIPGGNHDSVERRTQRSRLLLACGAAAGVSAGFNAPLAGVFFALEIVQGAFQTLSKPGEDSVDAIVTATSGNISAILISSVLSALTARSLLGEHLIFDVKEYALSTPLLELPIYVMLGALAGVVAFLFSQAASLSKDMFDGKAGPQPVRRLAQALPNPFKPVIGGLICGLAGIVFPQILFFGYETLNALVANESLPPLLLFSLLIVKILTTAIAAGSGLVGGTFAPSLFLGGMLGGLFHNFMSWIFSFQFPYGTAIQFVAGGPALLLADVPAYAMVGAASVLAALFRAPLTASLLMFELTRDYDVILPLMASAGVGSLVSDLIETKVERLKRRDEDAVSWGDLSIDDDYKDRDQYAALDVNTLSHNDELNDNSSSSSQDLEE